MEKKAFRVFINNAEICLDSNSKTRLGAGEIGPEVVITKSNIMVNTKGVNFPPVILFKDRHIWRVFTDQNLLRGYIESERLEVNKGACLEHIFLSGSTCYEWYFKNSYICPPRSSIKLMASGIDVSCDFLELNHSKTDYNQARNIFLGNLRQQLSSVDRVDIGVSGGLDSRLALAVASEIEGLTISRCHILVDKRNSLWKSVDELSAEKICSIYNLDLTSFGFDKREFSEILDDELKSNLIGTCEVLKSSPDATTTCKVHLTGSNGILVDNPVVEEIDLDYVLTSKGTFSKRHPNFYVRKAFNFMFGSDLKTTLPLVEYSNEHEYLRSQLGEYFLNLSSMSPSEALLNFTYFVSAQKNSLGMFESFGGRYTPMSLYADVVEPALKFVHPSDLQDRKFVKRVLADLNPHLLNVQGQGSKSLQEGKLRKLLALVSLATRGSGVMNYRQRAQDIEGFYKNNSGDTVESIGQFFPIRKQLDPLVWANIRKVNKVLSL